MGDVAAVVGASGYTGGELLRLLGMHPSLAVGPVFGDSSAGRVLGSVHRNLSRLGTRRLEAVDDLVADPAGLLGGVDVVFLALPHGHSGRVAGAITTALGGESPVLIDLGADHRLESAAAWARYYGPDADSHAGAWTYGLPELPGARARIARSRTVANPGCYPTSVALAMAPLLSAGLATPEADVVVVAASGTSGAGRAVAPALLGSEVMGSLSAYKAGGTHQHTPEMMQTLTAAAGREVVVSFTPILAPMPRGILATCSVPVARGTTTPGAREVLLETYGDEPFVRVLEAGDWPRTADVLGSNSAHLGVAVDEEAGRLVVICAIDNLVKGAAGQAIQNANLTLGLDERQGLPADGVAP